MKEQPKHIFTVVLGGWSIMVLWHFFKSFPLIHLSELFANGILLVTLLVFFTAVGKRVLRAFQITFASDAEETVFSFGIGTGVIIFLIIGLATLSILYKALVVLVCTGLAITVYKDARELCIKVYQALSDFSFKGRSKIEVALMLFIGGAIFVTFLAAATPPFFYDALVYHLAVPSKYLLRHGFHYIPHHHFSNFPANLGMLFIVGMSFSGGMLAKLIAWSFAPMTAFAVYAFAKPRWKTPVAITSAVIVLLVPGILILSTLTTVDNGVMFYSFLSFAALISWFTSQHGANVYEIR